MRCLKRMGWFSFKIRIATKNLQEDATDKWKKKSAVAAQNEKQGFHLFTIIPFSSNVEKAAGG